MKTRRLLVIAILVVSLCGLFSPATSQAVEETEGTLTLIVTVLYDGSGVVFFTDTPSSCGEVGYFLPKTVSNYTENFVALMHARRNGERVLVTTSGCWSVNPCYGKVLGISVGR